MDNSVKLAMLGRISIATQLDEGHRIAIRRHNEEVDRNRHILSKIIDAVKAVAKVMQDRSERPLAVMDVLA